MIINLLLEAAYAFKAGLGETGQRPVKIHLYKETIRTVQKRYLLKIY
jgi:hypothetical protein